MFGLGFGELVLIFLIALIFIGPKKLPELAKGLGQGIKEFQKAAKGLTDEIQNSAEPEKKEIPKVVDASTQHTPDTHSITPEEKKDTTKS
jgi:sec-independent protein translocase protein TatA